MSPRRYAMRKREKLAAATRQRIVESTLALHSEFGILGTSWKDIAKRADVSIGTVYRHFPSLDDLLPACGALMMERYRPPQPEDAEAIIGTAGDPATRLAAVIAAIYGFYHRAGPAAEIDPRERKLAAIQAWEEYWSGVLSTLVQAALSPIHPDAATLALAEALLDQRAFAAMTARGIGVEESTAEITGLIMVRLERAGPHKKPKERRK